MYLKTLSLAGFKSFADRTRLDFEAGVTVVVGPNGSGKSNLLDALAWVMGTQATSALRTERMEDVIFAGTATRPPLNRAEVVVTFDNSDRFLPLDLNEITMTRRLYRDGTSEYALNGTPCRLLDLHELLSDGGVGRHQHVLVGQGQIGGILSARADEHRSVIEEAAGITKHRQRRDRSVRRLEQTDLDITRLTDILDEQRRHLRPLKRQANAAERHEGVRAEIRALRLWLGGEQLRTLRDRLAADGAEQGALTAAIAGHEEQRRLLASSLVTLRQAAGEVGHALERDTAAAARLETVAERYHRIALVARERRYSFESRRRGAGERRHDLEEESVAVAAEIERCVADERAAAAEAERREAALTALEDEERSLAEQAQLPAEGMVATLRGDLRALETAAERDRREADALGRRRDVVEARLAEEAERAAQLVTEIQQTDVAVGQAQAAHAAAHQVGGRARDELEQAEERLRRDELARARASARLEAVEAALAGMG
ncbi:MAG: AAA family ATPase, partial [Acidimicrobiia bacterium]